MGWCDGTYRYRQYKNALEYIERQKSIGTGNINVDIYHPIEPRTEWTLLRTLVEALREVVRDYRFVAVLIPDRDDDEKGICSACNGEIRQDVYEYDDETYFCPHCGCEFVGEHIAKELDAWEDE